MSPPRRSRGGDYSPRKDDRRERDYDRRDRTRSPVDDREPRDRHDKDRVDDAHVDREHEPAAAPERDEHENGANGEEPKGMF